MAEPDPTAPSRPPAVERARQAALVASGLLLAALLVTGVVLFFWYRPDPSSFPAVDGLVHDGGIEQGLRRAHGALSWLFLAGVGAVLVTTIWGEVLHPERELAWVLVGGGLAVLSLATAFSGLLLPWDQLAVEAIRTGEDLRGVRAVFRDDVVFVLIGNAEIAVSTYRWWAVIHLVLLPLVLVVVGTLLARRAWHRRDVTQP